MFATILYSNSDTPVATPTPMPFIGGWVGNGINQANNWADLKMQEITDSISQGIYEGFLKIMSVIGEVAFQSAKIGIICCMLTYYVSEDKKAISFGMKLFFAYIIIAALLSKAGM